MLMWRASGAVDMRVEIVLPLPPSVNHYYRNAMVTVTTKTGKRVTMRKRVLTARAKAWIQGAGLMAKLALQKAGYVIPEAGAKVVVEIRVAWPDNRRRDMSNLHKPIGDFIEGIAYVNDQYALLRDMDYRIDRAHPGLHLIVRPHDND